MAIFATIATSLIGGAISSAFAPSGSTSPQGAAAASDPFAAQRPQYQTQLSNMMKPGAQFNAQDPSYAWRFNQGLVGLERSNAASGRTASGAEMAAATEYGQGMASQEYGNQFSRLSQLAGGNIGSPAAAGQILSTAGQQQQSGATAFGNQIGAAAGPAISNWFSSPSQTPAGVNMSGVNQAISGQPYTFGQPAAYDPNAWMYKP